ncbi:hypothetical protein PsorP6_010615 [Peronosclerospora sorghi]|uniref:Uncharacterized protein n=1 Tax=Peronosclerospora sorghi TaxID=230839 RepID=A0ACC0VXS3_9STRA|nr:hypothetical protein PsorP6_010615 [Peronosclerospora sorghi]
MPLDIACDVGDCSAWYTSSGLLSAVSFLIPTSASTFGDRLRAADRIESFSIMLSSAPGFVRRLKTM